MAIAMANSAVVDDDHDDDDDDHDDDDDDHDDDDDDHDDDGKKKENNKCGSVLRW